MIELRAAARVQHPSPGAAGRPRASASELKRPQAGGALVHRPLRFGQVDHRQPGRAASCTAQGIRTFLLDGDNVRHGLNRDLGFTDADRVENIRRVGEVAKLFVDAGADRAVLVHLAVPRRAADGARAVRRAASSSRSSSTRRSRNASSATRRASTPRRWRGEIANFTGITSPYEAPENAELTVETCASTAEQAAEAVLAELRRRGVI